jgi:sestrin
VFEVCQLRQWFVLMMQRQLEFASAFVQNSQLDHVTQVMGFHPRYLHAFQAMRQFLLQGDGPLPIDQRHYIAIMVSDEVY